MAALSVAGRSASPTIAIAPAARACGMKAAPSALVPGTATKTDPGRTLRLSAVRPETVRPACSDPRASGKRSARVVNEPVLPPQAPLCPLPPCGGELERGGAGRGTPTFGKEAEQESGLAT